MVIRHTALFIAFSLACLFSAGCTDNYIKVHSLKATVSEAPEVHGANTSQKPHSGTFRFTGKINSNRPNTSHEQISNHIHGSTYFTDVYYKLGGIDFSAKADFFYKRDEFFFGTGVGYKDGIYHNFLLGANMQHLEFGLFFGLYHQYSNLSYEVSRCTYDYDILTKSKETCEPSYKEQIDRFNHNPFMGGFAGIILDKMFFNYSVSVYSPQIKIEDYSLDAAIITSNYLTLGYRLNKWVEISGGAIITYLDTPLGYDGFSVGTSLYF